MSYAEMRMHATTPQIPTPSQASYPNHQYPAAHTKPLHHQYPWPGATPSMGEWNKINFLFFLVRWKFQIKYTFLKILEFPVFLIQADP